MTDGVDQHPHCVVLLDEIEKAHPDIYNILLQVMDHGSLTDHNGKKIDFRNVILIMTTNAGASEMAKSAIGFGSSKRTGEDEEALNRLFTPEFRNRLDAIIPFAPLPTDGHPQGRPEVRHAAGNASCRNATSPSTCTRMPSPGWRRRAMTRRWVHVRCGRVIQEHIKKPLANEILFGKLEEGRRRQRHGRQEGRWQDGLILDVHAGNGPV